MDIDVADIDEAIAWAKKSPAAKTGHIEIRPVVDY
ncbi:MAG: YciI family protein [Brevibacterium sp.]